MSSSRQPLTQSGIYRNLPSFDPAIKDLKAIMCGATGISGFHALRALLDSPERWSKVYAISRSPLSHGLLSFFTEEQRSRIHHVSIDLSSSAEKIAEVLQASHVSAEYVFYYAYLPPKTDKSAMDPSTAGDLVESNVPPFQNFLDALPIAQIKPKRILLQTGGKNYGLHIGRVRRPLLESDPQPRHLSPNFYYPQEDILRSFCEAHPETSWNRIMPAGIIGATENASMNTFLNFGLYASIQAHKKEPITFGSDLEAWQFEVCHSTARLTGYLSEWAVLEEQCANQAFNAHDGGSFSFDRFFYELARWYGVPEVCGPETDESKFKVTTFAGGKAGPLGYGPPFLFKQSFQLADWAKDPLNKKAWEEMMAQSNGQLTKNVYDADTNDFSMADFATLPFGQLSLNKVRRFGFCGYVDTLESIFEMFQDMEKLGMLPQMKVDSARPLI
jgi:nucleoside-diphosphate-sugar epimerase